MIRRIFALAAVIGGVGVATSLLTCSTATAAQPDAVRTARADPSLAWVGKFASRLAATAEYVR